MKLRTPVTAARPPVCRRCGEPITALLRTEVDAAAGVVRIDGRCPAGHAHAELRPLPHPAANPAPPAT